MANDATIKFGYDGTALNTGLRAQETALKTFAAKTESRFAQLGSKIGGYLKTAVIGEGIRAGIAAVGKSLTSAGDILDLAERLNTTGESVQRLGAIARKKATDVETITAALERLNVSMASSADNPAAAAALEDMGLSAGALARLQPDEQILRLAEAFQQAEASGTGYSQLLDLIGKNANELLPLLRSPLEELRELAAKPVLSESQLELMKIRVEQTTDAVKDMTNVMRDAAAAGADMTFSDEESVKIKREVESRQKARDVLREQSAARLEAAASTGKLSDAEAKAATAAKEEAAARAQGLSDLRAELGLLELKARGKDKAAEKMQREMDIMQRSRQLQQDLGINAAQATAIATRETDLKADVAARENGGRRRIKGYSMAQGPTRGFTGLAGYDLLQRYDSSGVHYDAFDQGTSRFARRGGPLANISGSLTSRRGRGGMGGGSLSQSSQYTGLSVQQGVQRQQALARAATPESVPDKLDELITVTRKGLLDE